MKKLVIASVLAIACLGAGADTIGGNEESCNALSWQVGMTAQLRNEGKTWKEIKPFILKGLEAAKGNPESWVHDSDDVARVLTALELPFLPDFKDLSPEQLAKGYWSLCMFRGNGIRI